VFGGLGGIYILIKERIKEKIKRKIRREIREAPQPNKDNTLIRFLIGQKGGSIPVLSVALFPCPFWMIDIQKFTDLIVLDR
jgi:hypothetical protein